MPWRVMEDGDASLRGAGWIDRSQRRCAGFPALAAATAQFAAHPLGVLHQHQRQVVDLLALEAGDTSRTIRSFGAPTFSMKQLVASSPRRASSSMTSSISGFTFSSTRVSNSSSRWSMSVDAVGGRDDGEGLVLFGQGCGRRRRRRRRRLTPGMVSTSTSGASSRTTRARWPKVAKVEASPSTRKTRSRPSPAARRCVRRRVPRPWPESRGRGSSGRPAPRHRPARQMPPRSTMDSA
jgi:hypothetical protein